MKVIFEMFLIISYVLLIINAHEMLPVRLNSCCFSSSTRFAFRSRGSSLEGAVVTGAIIHGRFERVRPRSNDCWDGIAR